VSKSFKIGAKLCIFQATKILFMVMCGSISDIGKMIYLKNLKNHTVTTLETAPITISLNHN